jgi:hypothetical protein
MANTPSFYNSEMITPVKRVYNSICQRYDYLFIHLTLMNQTNKLECLFPFETIQPRLLQDQEPSQRCYQ